MVRMLASLGLGAALMYLFDSRSGRRRRARLRDRVMHAIAAERHLLGKARRDLANRSHAIRTGETVRDTSDEVTIERVHSAIGRVSSHGSIEASIDGGVVALRGAIFEHEVPTLLHALRRLPGVRSIDDRLVRHRVADAALREPIRSGLAPAPRVALGTAGALLLLSGRTLARAGGAVMLVRAIANDDLARVVGLKPATIAIDKTVTIDAPVDRVFALCAKVQRFPTFMEHVRSVHPGERGKSRWVIDGPFGTSTGFEAELVRFERDRLIAWRTLPGSDLEHEGNVRFEEVDDGTRIHIQLHYRPPGGMIGHALARALGFDPRSRLDDDVLRAKALLENGKTRAHSQRVKLGDIPPYS